MADGLLVAVFVPAVPRCDVLIPTTGGVVDCSWGKIAKIADLASRGLALLWFGHDVLRSSM